MVLLLLCQKASKHIWNYILKYIWKYIVYIVYVYISKVRLTKCRGSPLCKLASLYTISRHYKGFIYIVSEERLACKRARSTGKSQRKGRRWTKKAKSAHSLRVSYHRKKVKGVYFGDICGGSAGELFF